MNWNTGMVYYIHPFKKYLLLWPSSLDYRTDPGLSRQLLENTHLTLLNKLLYGLDNALQVDKFPRVKNLSLICFCTIQSCKAKQELISLTIWKPPVYFLLYLSTFLDLPLKMEIYLISQLKKNTLYLFFVLPLPHTHAVHSIISW